MTNNNDRVQSLMNPYVLKYCSNTIKQKKYLGIKVCIPIFFKFPSEKSYIILLASSLRIT